MEKGHSYMWALGVRVKVLDVGIHIHTQELVEGQAKVRDRNHQVLKVVPETAADHNLEEPKVVPVMGDDRSLALTDFFHNLQILNRHTDQVCLVVHSHCDTNTQAAAFPVLVATPLPSLLHQLLLPLAPSEFLLFRSRPYPCLDLAHTFRLLVLYRTLVADHNLLFLYLESLESSSYRQNTGFAVSAVPIDLFSFQQGASDRTHLKAVRDCRTHLSVHYIHRGLLVYLQVRLLRVRQTYWAPHLNIHLDCLAHLVMS